VELEPLYQCNLACSGCGKIQHPDHVLRRRMPVDQAVGAIEECGAPMVSIAGGEPLIHPEIHVIAAS
jgi:MoaA/NifB/PqqE/SkfB family radical SAM enzyme